MHYLPLMKQNEPSEWQRICIFFFHIKLDQPKKEKGKETIEGYIHDDAKHIKITNKNYRIGTTLLTWFWK